nr:terpene cyclase [Penicillium meliponae]
MLSILLPTLYLWMVDFISLRRGTWVIEKDTKMDVRLWGYLDIEEAIFFLVSNIMVVFGLISVDHGIAIAEYETVASDSASKATPSLYRIAWQYLAGPKKFYDLGFLRGLSAAIDKLAQKSQSMYLGSAMFQDRLRVDLILLYSFCRVIDDLVDEAPDRETAQANVKEARQVLHWRFSTKRTSKPLYDYLEAGKKESKDDASLPLILSIALLPTSRLTMTPLLELLSGFEMDLQFSAREEKFPIQTEADLDLYAYRVAGTVASSLLELVFSHYGLDQADFPPEKQNQIIQAGQRMGQALQYVNIARDIRQDATLGRVYIPNSWLQEEMMSPSDVIAGDDPRIAIFEDRMLRKGAIAHDSSVRYIDMLPFEARGPVKTTVESYMMIGDMVRKRRRQGLHDMPGKLKVPLWQRVVRAWGEMQH